MCGHCLFNFIPFFRFKEGQLSIGRIDRSTPEEEIEVLGARESQSDKEEEERERNNSA